MSEPLPPDLDAFLTLQQSGNDANFLGGDPGAIDAYKQSQADATSYVDLQKKAYSVFNTGADIAQATARKMIAPDPNFRVADHMEELGRGIPQEMWPEFNTTASLEEARAMRNDILSDMRDIEIIGRSGMRGVAAGLAAGIVDVDLPIMLISGGSLLGAKGVAGLAKLEKAGRLGKAAATAVTAAEANTISAAGHAFASPSGRWTDVPAAAMDGMLFGATLGSLTKTEAKANSTFESARKDFHESDIMGGAGRTDYTTATVTPNETFKDNDFTGGLRPENDPSLKVGSAMFEHLLPQEGTTFRRALERDRAEAAAAQAANDAENLPFTKESVGAASTGVRQEGFEPAMADSTTLKMREKAEQYLESEGIEARQEEAFPNTMLGQMAKKFQKAVDKTPFQNDYQALMNSDSKIAQALAHSTLESASGIARNNKSASMLQEIYKSQLENPVNGNYDVHLTQWIKDNIDSLPDINVKPRFIGQSIEVPGFNVNLNKVAPNVLHPMMRKLASENREAFNRAVITELQFRLHEGRSSPNVHPAVKAMADAIDNGSAIDVRIKKGLSGENAVNGAENLKERAGYFPQRVKGSKINKIVGEAQSSTKALKAIENALVENYRRLYPQWTPEHARIYAKAVISNARGKEIGMDINAKNFLDNDGRGAVEQVLRNGGVSEENIDAIIKALSVKREEQGVLGSLKERADIDLRAPIPGTNYTLMDIVDTDIPAVWTRHARESAGASALARHGIQRTDIAGIIDAILKEQIAHPGSKSPKLTRERLEGIFSYFSGGLIAGGVDPAVRRMMGLTRLSLLNQLGMTQLMEVGAQVGAVGWEAFLKTAPKEFADTFKGRASPLMEELRPYMAQVTGEHMLHLNHLNIDEVQAGATALGQQIDKVLANGSKLQGYTSLFFKVNQAEQRAAINGMVYKLAQHFQGKKKVSAERLYDIGLGDPKLQSKLEKYFKEVVEFTEDGQVLKLNFDKWKEADVQELALALNRHVGQVVQKAQRGESSVWMHKSIGAMFSELKSFTFTAMQKQTIRNMRLADTEALGTALYGLLSAGIVYAGKQALNGNDQNLTPEQVVKGAVINSNVLGGIASTSDILTGILGMNSLQFGAYGQSGRGTDLLQSPTISTMNRIARIPGAIGSLTFGQGSPSDIYSLQAAPIIGNMYGLTGIFNSMKQDMQQERQKERSAESRAKRKEEDAALTEKVRKEATTEVTNNLNATIQTLEKTSKE